MTLLVCINGMSAAPWLEGFRAALPELTVVDWFASPATQGEFAFVWSPPAALFETQPGLRVVFNAGAGVNAILALPNLPAHVPIVRLEDAGMAEQMAEYVCCAALRHFRDLALYAEYQAAGQWKRKQAPKRAEFPVGVMGLGAIGVHVAQMLSSFGFAVAGWSLSPKSINGVNSYAGAQQFDAFLAQTRILVCLLPLTQETENIIDAASLAKLRPGAYVINVARGAHVVDADLLAAIESGQVAGATLDVFRDEPLPAGHAFWASPKITVTPHISAATLRDESIAQVAGKIRQVLTGKAPEHLSGVVDVKRGY